MAAGSSSKTQNNGEPKKLDSVDPFVTRRDHNPRELKSWAKRTGFVSNFSGESESTIASEKFQFQNERIGGGGLDLEKGLDSRGGLSPKIEIDPILGRAKANRGPEIELEPEFSSRDGAMTNVGLKDVNVGGENKKRRVGDEPVFVEDDENERNRNSNEIGNGTVGIDVDPYDDGQGHRGWLKSAEMKCGLTHNPGFVPLLYYGWQHYLSMAGSLIFIPLIMVPAMGGTDKDTATVISTMLFVSGITTILQSYFGTRLPLVQGGSFVYLAPALVIINSREYRNLTEHKFRYIMRELQGAIIVGSIFQCVLGLTGFMSLLLRMINPVVVASTVAAVGLAFFSYGFPQAGSCVEISIPLILLVLIFTLYLRKISVFGHHIFRIYAVPLSVVIIWAYAFFLTAGGAYDYKGCSSDIPSSNILVDRCRNHAYTMKHCRTDVSNAWNTANWIRIPYPLQWGIPVFSLRTSIIMIIASFIASIDSVGTYHSASHKANLKPPTPGIVSRGIGLEAFCSILAGLWGSGTGSSTLTENVHTIDVTKVASRRAVQLGAVFLIMCSFLGKVGAILASIPQALAASVLCFMWALIVALGLSALQYSQASSFRNNTIVGVSLFLGLSIPAYFQQYQPVSTLILPGYFIPYSAASNGPVNSGNKQVDFAVNALISLSMVVAFLVAFVLDNSVPGSRQERGVYVWSSAEDIATDSSFVENYSLPRRFAKLCCWSKCLR